MEAISRAICNFDHSLEKVSFGGSIPESGLTMQNVQRILMHLASLDSNNRFSGTPIGASREGRILSPLVEQLHLGFSHGITLDSRSLTEYDPKAVGSSAVLRIANEFALDAIRYIGIPDTKAALVVPFATGMSLSMCLDAWRREKPNAHFVVFLRIDQKSCFKSILMSCLEPIIIDCLQKTTAAGDGLTTNLTALETVLRQQSSEIIAVLSTTSCFAPREPDDLVAVGELCAKYGVKHLVNNAYGLQSPECCARIQEAGLAGNIDAFVQSLDKNFLVPVGGSIVATFDDRSLNNIANTHAGRMSVVPSRDLVITLLQLGKTGLRELYNAQQTNFAILHKALEEYSETIGQKIMDVKTNRISLALTLKGWSSDQQIAFGAHLFSRGVTGARTVPNGLIRRVDGYEFYNFGSHSSNHHDGYLNIACGIGMTIGEIQELLKILKDVTPKWAFSSSKGES